MKPITIRHLKNGEWVIRQLGEWAVYQSSFSGALCEAFRYAVQYECTSELDNAIAAFVEKSTEKPA